MSKLYIPLGVPCCASARSLATARSPRPYAHLYEGLPSDAFAPPPVPRLRRVSPTLWDGRQHVPEPQRLHKPSVTSQRGGGRLVVPGVVPAPSCFAKQHQPAPGRAAIILSPQQGALPALVKIVRGLNTRGPIAHLGRLENVAIGSGPL